jgi:hypothetical protein
MGSQNLHSGAFWGVSGVRCIQYWTSRRHIAMFHSFPLIRTTHTFTDVRSFAMKTLSHSLTRFSTAAYLSLVALFCTLPMQDAHADWSWGGKGVSASGTNKTETRAVSGFTGISLGLPAKVTIKQGSTEGLVIDADEAFLPYIETVVERGTLRIRTSERNINFKGRFKMDITVNAINLESLAVAGSGDILADALNGKDFSVSIAGSGKLDVKALNVSSLDASIAGSGDVIIAALKSDSLKARISGSGDIRIGGTAESSELRIAGSGDIKTERLKTKNTKISIAGSGNAAVWPTETLNISIAGSGDVRHYGEPKITKSVAGSGSIKSLGAAPAPL